MTAPAVTEDAIFHRLRDAIRSRQLAPGTRLREAKICALLNTSRGKVRKALARLAHEGLVDLAPNRGASVARPTVQDATDLFEARKHIEGAIARLAMQRMTPRALSGLDAHLELEKAARRDGDDDAVTKLSGEFHVLLADIAANTALKRYLEDIVSRESLIIQLFQKPQRTVCSEDEHLEIVRALRSGNEDAVIGLIEAHIETIAGGLDLSVAPQRVRSLEEVLGQD